MEKFGWRGFFELLIGGILLLSIVFLGFRLYLCQKEYDNYRDGIFCRAYEGSISLLGTYILEKDPGIASSLNARLNELPLSAKEKDTVQSLTADIAESDRSREAKERSLAYSEELLLFLSYARSEAYQSGWRRGALGLPDYPPIAQPTVYLPKEEEDAGPVKAAQILLGASVIRYERGERVCFRTASGFAEYENGRLVRALIDRQVGDEEASSELLTKSALAFLDAQGYRTKDLTLLSSERRSGMITLCYESKELSLTLSLTKDNGRLHSFLAEGKERSDTA